MTHPQFRKFPQVSALRGGESRSTNRRRINDGLFTKPVALGPRAKAWPEHEVLEINAALIRGASDDEIRQLVRDLEKQRTAFCPEGRRGPESRGL
jgi:prophage regulatory protein